MKLASIFCLYTVFICAEGGLIKNLLGTVTSEVHDVSHGIIKNVVNIIDKATHHVVGDVSHILHIRRTTPKTYSIEPMNNTETQVMNFPPKTSTITNENNIEDNTPSNNVKSVNEPNRSKNDLIENDSYSSDYNFGEGVISPRIGRERK